MRARGRVHRLERVDRLFCQRGVAILVSYRFRRPRLNQRVVRQHFGLLVFREEEREAIHGRGTHCFGQCALHTALLDADIHDAGHVVRQRQVGVGLDEQQQHGQQQGHSKRFEVFQNASHASPL